MAFLGQDDKQLQDQAQQASQGAGGSSSATPLTGGTQSAIGGGSGAGSSASSTLPASQSASASGGGDGWTNIQNYLTANQGQTGSANALSQAAGGAFDREKGSFDQDSGNAKSQAQAQVAGQMGQDQASQLLQDATNTYSYGAPNATYQSDISQLQGALGASYQGPKDFSRGMGAEAQNYGSNLGSDQGFNAIMNALYNQSSGGQMSSGSKALQQQLDNNNDALKSTRGSLTSQYSGLQNYEQQGAKDTNSAIQSAQTQFGQNVSGLRGSLTSSAAKDQAAINQRVSDANAFLTRTAPFADHGVTDQDPGNSTWWGYTYDPSSGPTASNVGGVTDQRNGYNAIQDALGLQGAKINQDAAYDPNSARFNYQGYVGGQANPNWAGSENLQSLAQETPLIQASGLDYNAISNFLNNGGPLPQIAGPGPGRQNRLG